jgi:hypothetical protein
MWKLRLTEEQIIAILAEQERGVAPPIWILLDDPQRAPRLRPKQTLSLAAQRREHDERERLLRSSPGLDHLSRFRRPRTHELPEA